MKILCVVPCLPEDFNPKMLFSILNQTVPVDMIVLLPKKVEGRTIAEKVSKVLNEALSHIKIEDFDYILRVDCDTVIPPNFIEENLKGEPDLCGQSGHAMLIKVEAFKKAMNLRLHPQSDDGYLTKKFMMLGLNVQKWKVKPIHKKRLHSPIEMFRRGILRYKYGHEPFHILFDWRHDIRNIFAIFGYFYALLKREKKFDVADYVWHKQVRRLLQLF
ncbi:hypothetical protein J7K27_10525 [Candidatus Bathyarchaeota archaeon]|nr:hypothetical protein [Candidatus Bathyarchaeota archaeon]